jgi:protein-disulfide isomerase
VQILVSVAVVAVLAVVIAVAVGGGGDDSSPTKTTSKKQVDALNGLFAGIPASGMALGNPDAPATLEEFVDPQCPFSAMCSRP